MDPLTINRMGNFRHEEILAESEQLRHSEPRWKLTNLVAFVRQRAANLAPTRRKTFDVAQNVTD